MKIVIVTCIWIFLFYFVLFFTKCSLIHNVVTLTYVSEIKNSLLCSYIVFPVTCSRFVFPFPDFKPIVN